MFQEVYGSTNFYDKRRTRTPIGIGMPVRIGLDAVVHELCEGAFGAIFVY